MGVWKRAPQNKDFIKLLRENPEIAKEVWTKACTKEGAKIMFKGKQIRVIISSVCD